MVGPSGATRTPTDILPVVLQDGCRSWVRSSVFGLGFERTVYYITGLANVRDVIPFPRTPGNAKY